MDDDDDLGVGSGEVEEGSQGSASGGAGERAPLGVTFFDDAGVSEGPWAASEAVFFARLVLRVVAPTSLDGVLPLPVILSREPSLNQTDQIKSAATKCSELQRVRG